MTDGSDLILSIDKKIISDFPVLSVRLKESDATVIEIFRKSAFTASKIDEADHEIFLNCDKNRFTMTVSGANRFVAVVAEDGTIRIPGDFAGAGTTVEILLRQIPSRKSSRRKPLAFAEKFKGFLRPVDTGDEKYQHIMKKHA